MRWLRAFASMHPVRSRRVCFCGAGVAAALLLLVLTPLCGTAAWSPTIRLTEHYQDSWEPRITGDATGRLHLVWADRRDNNMVGEVFYKTKGPEDVEWSPDLKLSDSPYDSDCPDIAADASLNLHVVWWDFRDGNTEIYYKRFDHLSSTWGADERLTVNPATSMSPRVAVDTAGRVHVVWWDGRNGNAVYYKRWDGVSWSADELISPPGFTAYNPAITSDANGLVHVVWQDQRIAGNYEIYYRSLAGTTWSGDTRISNGTGDSRDADITCDASGNPYVVWSDARSGSWDIWYSRYAGGTWTNDVRLTYAWGEYRPSVAVDIQGHIYVAWEDSRDHGPDASVFEIYAMEWDGRNWGPNERLTFDDLHRSNAPVLYADLGPRSDGLAHLAWRNDSGGFDIFYRFAGPLVGVEPDPAPPVSLVRVAPNPWRTEVTFEVQQPEPGYAAFKIYDVRGRHLRTLHDGSLPQGGHLLRWNGCDEAGRRQRSGIYFYRFDRPGAAVTGRFARIE